MNRKLKALALALVAAFATSAVAASTASASGEQFHSSVDHTIIAASAGHQVFSTTVDEVTCDSVNGSGTINATTVSEITLTNVTYSGCEFVGWALTGHIKMRSCDYLFTSEATPHAPLHINCSTAGDHIRIDATFLGAEVGCIRIPPQTPTGGGVTYSNSANNIVALITVTGIEYTEVGFCDPDRGVPNVANDGTYTGSLLVSGKDTGGNTVAVSHG